MLVVDLGEASALLLHTSVMQPTISIYHMYTVVQARFRLIELRHGTHFPRRRGFVLLLGTNLAALVSELVVM